MCRCWSRCWSRGHRCHKFRRRSGRGSIGFRRRSGRLWCRARQVHRVPDMEWEVLLQSQVRFKRVSKKILEKVVEKVPGGFGAEQGQVQQVRRRFWRSSAMAHPQVKFNREDLRHLAGSRGNPPLPRAKKILYMYIWYTSSTAQGGGVSFKNSKPTGEVGCCESGMAERSHWWTERCLISFTLSISFSDYLPTYLFSMYPSIYRSIYLALALSLFHLITNLSIYLSVYLSIYLIYLPFICLSV